MPPIPLVTPRDRLLVDWIARHAGRLGLDPDTLVVASADASFRRYFRVASRERGSVVLMDAPPDRERIGPFLHARAVFERAGVHVPALYDVDETAGILVLEDFGSTSYLDALIGARDGLAGVERVDALYRSALDALIVLQRAPADRFGPYDGERQRRDLELFREWYCIRHLGIEPDPDTHAVLDRTFERLVAHNTAQPQVATHWDYHSRNLMVLARGGCGVIDFQDAVVGPITYDLVSLLRDAYIRWDESQVIDWVARWWDSARRAALPVDADFGVFWRDFEWMGLHRHLRVLGIFARLKHRDGKDGYLKDMPLVLEYARACAQRYEAFAPLARWFDALERRATVA